MGHLGSYADFTFLPLLYTQKLRMSDQTRAQALRHIIFPDELMAGHLPPCLLSSRGT